MDLISVALDRRPPLEPLIGFPKQVLTRPVRREDHLSTMHDLAHDGAVRNTTGELSQYVLWYATANRKAALHFRATIF